DHRQRRFPFPRIAMERETSIRDRKDGGNREPLIDEIEGTIAVEIDENAIGGIAETTARVFIRPPAKDALTVEFNCSFDIPARRPRQPALLATPAHDDFAAMFRRRLPFQGEFMGVEREPPQGTIARNKIAVVNQAVPIAIDVKGGFPAVDLV